MGASDVLYGMPICETGGEWSRKETDTRHCAGSDLGAALYMALCVGAWELRHLTQGR